MATCTRWRLQQWLRWLHGQDRDYHSGLDGYMDKMETTTVAKMATWTRWRLQQCPRWLHGHDGDDFSVVDGQEDNHNGKDCYMENIETTTVSYVTSWIRWRLPQWLKLGSYAQFAPGVQIYTMCVCLAM